MTSEGIQTWFDRLFACLLGGSVAVLSLVSGNGLEFPPELWEKVAVAARLRPPEHEFPLLWQFCLSFFVDVFGIDRCLEALKILGPVSLGILSAMAYRLFSGYLPAVMRGEMNYTRWGRWIVRITIALGTAMFVCSEPVWLASRVLSPEMSSLLSTVLALLLALWAVEKSSALCFVLAGLVSGVLAAETPLAVLIPVLARHCLSANCGPIVYGEMQVLANPLVLAVAVRRTACAFVLGWISACAANISFFVRNGGGGEIDANMFMAIAKYFLNYFHVTVNAMTPMGFLLISLVVLFPLLVVMFRKNVFADVHKILSVPGSCFLATVGMMAILQSSGFSGFHFWKWETDIVKDPYVICLCLFGTSVLAMNVIAVFAVDIFYRNYAKLMREIFPYEADSEPFAVKVLKSFKTSVKILRFPAHFVPVVVIGCILPFRFDPAVKEMSSIVNAIADRTADECGDAVMLFTDGSYDAAVEVAAMRKGKKIKALSMMSGTGKYDVALRLRGETNEENIALLKTGTADALRTWVHGDYACASNIAVQVGMELWQRNQFDLPAAGGFVARTAGFPEGEAERGIESAFDLAGKIENLYAKSDPAGKGYPSLNKMFLFGQWRLARMCRLRANAADAKKDWKLSEKESSLADRLDRLNPEWRKVSDKMSWIGRNSSMHLTPREGLKLGLARADFRMASSYAKRVLATDPDDMNANFALGMEFFTAKLYEKAEKHLKKCLVRAPGEPAVLNNLAVVQLRLGKLAEAEKNAEKAISLFPDSHEIKATLRHIKEAGKELK
jgi:tetratricopeptide (TPR) repeat protein